MRSKPWILTLLRKRQLECLLHRHLACFSLSKADILSGLVMKVFVDLFMLHSLEKPQGNNLADDVCMCEALWNLDIAKLLEMTILEFNMRTSNSLAFESFWVLARATVNQAEEFVWVKLLVLFSGSCEPERSYITLLLKGISLCRNCHHGVVGRQRKLKSYHFGVWGSGPSIPLAFIFRHRNHMYCCVGFQCFLLQ